MLVPPDPPLVEIATHLRAILRVLDVDLSDPDFAETPERVARLYADLFATPAAGELELGTSANVDGYSDLVSVRDVPFHGMCPHHLLPFYGHAHLAYLPGERLAGLGELVRVVELHGRRPRLQERLAVQMVDHLMTELRPRGAIVVLEARHLCVEMRGVRTAGAIATASAARGAFEEPSVREEFLRLVRHP